MVGVCIWKYKGLIVYEYGDNQRMVYDGKYDAIIR